MRTIVPLLRVPITVVKTVIQQKNRILGQYKRDCFMFGLIDDVEFKMLIEPIAVECDRLERT